MPIRRPMWPKVQAAAPGSCGRWSLRWVGAEELRHARPALLRVMALHADSVELVRPLHEALVGHFAHGLPVSDDQVVLVRTHLEHRRRSEHFTGRTVAEAWIEKPGIMRA